MVIPEADNYHTWGDGKMVVLAYTTIITIGGLLENSLVIFLFIYFKSLRTVTNNFIINLAACNLVLSVLELTFSLPSLFASDWIFGDVLAVLYAFSYFLLVSVSMVMLAVIAIDRYHVISRPKLRARISGPKSLLVIVVVYIYTFAIASPILYAPTGLEVRMYISGCYIDFTPTSNFGSGSYAVVILSLLYVVPLVTMVYYYWKIFTVLRNRRNRMANGRGKLANGHAKTTQSREGNTCVKTREGNTCVKTREGNTSVKTREGNTCVKTREGNTCVKTREGNTCVKTREDNTHVCTREGNTCVKTREGNTCVKTREDNTHVCTREGNTCVKTREVTTHVCTREGNTRVRIREDNTRVRPASTYTIRNTPVKTLRVIATLVILFIVTWTPFHVVTLARAFNQKEIFSDKTKEIIILLTKSVIIINPVAYALVNHRFQKCVAKLFCSAQVMVGATTCTENSIDFHFSRNGRGSTQESRRNSRGSTQELRRSRYPSRVSRLSSTPEVFTSESFTPAGQSILRHSHSDSQLGKHVSILETAEDNGAEQRSRRNTDHDRFVKLSIHESVTSF